MRAWSNYFLLISLLANMHGVMHAQDVALPDDAEYDYLLDQSDEDFSFPQEMYQEDVVVQEEILEPEAENVPEPVSEPVLSEQAAPADEQEPELGLEPQFMSEPESEPMPESEPAFMQQPEVQELAELAPSQEVLEPVSTEPAPSSAPDEQVPVASMSSSMVPTGTPLVPTEHNQAVSGSPIPVPPAPTKVSAKPVPVEVEGEEEADIGIDSINIDDPAGNWLLKRIWWEKAQQKYDKIKLRFDEVRQLRTAFFAERTDLDQNILDPFYFAIGVEQGELMVILEALAQEINQLKQKEGALTAQERELLEAVGAEQKMLQQLQEDVMAIREVDNAVDDALRRLMEQTDLCRTYETEAYQCFKDIGIELSDQNAKVLYYKMDAHSKNIANILRYIQTEFTTYFNQLITTARDRTERIKTTMALLKDKGIDFKNRAKILKDMSSHSVSADEQEQEDSVEQEGQKGNWYSSIVSIARSIGSAVTYVVSSITDWLGSIYTGIVGLFSGKNEKSAENVPVEAVELEEVVAVPPKTEE